MNLKKLTLIIFLFLLPSLACGQTDLDTTEAVVSTATPDTAEVSNQDEDEDSPTETIDSEEDVDDSEDTEESDSDPELTPTVQPSPEPTPTSEPTFVYLGELTEKEGYSFAAVTLEDPAPPGIIYTPEEGAKLVAVEVIVGNVSGERITVNPLNATLLDTEGFVYQAELAGRDEQLALVDLVPGQRVKGWIAFEIPENAIADTIKYSISSFPNIVVQSKVETEEGGVETETPPLTNSDAVVRDIEANLGDLVEKDGFSFTTQAVDTQAQPGIIYTPREGTKLVAIEIIVGNVSGEVVTVNALNAFLTDSQGFVYKSELGAIDSQIELVDLSPGERVQGWVAFEVPEDAEPASILYQVSGFPLIELESNLDQ